jgi:parallel beta-helix repeat protein
MFSTRKRPVMALFVFVLAIWLAIPATANATSGTMTVTQNTRLTEDHNGYIVIAADNLTLDCANHLITGTGGGNVIQIDGRSRVTVKNCKITGGDIGLSVTNSTGPNTLLNNVSFSNASHGIVLGVAGRTSLIANQVTDNGGDGVSLLGSSQNTLRGNSSAGNYGIGFAVSGVSNGNLLTMNQATRNTGPGFALDANQNLLMGNVAQENGGSGFDVFTGSDNVLQGNRSEGNTFYGFALWPPSSGSTLAMNQGIGNGWENFVLSSSRNRIVGNISRGSMYAGFSLVYGADYNVVSGNVATGNAGSGIDVIQSSHNSITGNRSMANNWNTESENGAGISLVEGSSFNCVLRNVAYGNGRVDAYDDHAGTSNVWKANHFGTSDI